MFHLQELQATMAPPPQLGPDGKPIAPVAQGASAAGGGQAMTNSNTNSGSTTSVPKGTNEKTAQNAGPR